MSQYKKGDIVYGYAVHHEKWAYCEVVNAYDDTEHLYGGSLKGDPWGFYKMEYSSIVPIELLESPLWKALK